MRLGENGIILHLHSCNKDMGPQMKIELESRTPAVKGERDWIYWLRTEKGDYIKVQIGFYASKEDAEEIIKRITQS